MCAAVIDVVGGNPLSSTLKSTVAAVMAPALFFVRLKWMVARPLAVDSAFVTAGTSLLGSRLTTNCGRLSSAAGAVLLLLQPVARTRAPISRERRFMSGAP